MVINLDLDQFNKLSIVLQVNVKLQTKPSSLLDCIHRATEHKVLKEIFAYYSNKKISGRSRAALKLKIKAQTKLPRHFFYGHWERPQPRRWSSPHTTPAYLKDSLPFTAINWFPFGVRHLTRFPLFHFLLLRVVMEITSCGEPLRNHPCGESINSLYY